MNTIISQGALLLVDVVNDSSYSARHAHHVDIGLDDLPELSCDRIGSHTQRERFCGFEIEEDANEDDREHHIHLLLGVYAMRMSFGLQRKRENVGGKVNVSEVANAVLRVSCRVEPGSGMTLTLVLYQPG